MSQREGEILESESSTNCSPISGGLGPSQTSPNQLQTRRTPNTMRRRNSIGSASGDEKVLGNVSGEIILETHTSISPLSVKRRSFNPGENERKDKENVQALQDRLKMLGRLGSTNFYPLPPRSGDPSSEDTSASDDAPISPRPRASVVSLSPRKPGTGTFNTLQHFNSERLRSSIDASMMTTTPTPNTVGHGSLRHMPVGHSVSVPSTKSRKKFSIFAFSSSERFEKNIPFFACPLQEVVKRGCCDGIPTLMHALFSRLESAAETEGLFRIAGVAAKVTEMVNTVNHGEWIEIAQQDPHDLSSFLSRFLDELPEPLLTFDLYDSFMQIGEIEGTTKEAERARHQLFSEILSLLPDAHVVFLKRLVQVVLKVAEKRQVNKMGVPNIAIVFAPLILRDEQLDPRLALTDAISANKVVTYLFNHFNSVPLEGLLPEKERGVERKKRRKHSEEWRLKRSQKKPNAKDFHA